MFVSYGAFTAWADYKGECPSSEVASCSTATCGVINTLGGRCKADVVDRQVAAET